MRYLCAIEAVNLDNMFADCQDLSTSRGGGLAVRNIGELVVKRLSADAARDVRKVSAGASQGVVSFDAESAAQAEELVRAALFSGPWDQKEILRNATIMVAAVEWTGEFATQAEQLRAEIRWKQMQSPSVVYPALHGKTVCDIDRLRPALQRSDLSEKKNQSDFTHARRSLGKATKHSLFGFEVFEDLNKLASGGGKYGNADEKIAVFRFDGNDFGKQAKECELQSEEALRVFSETVKRQHEDFFKGLSAAGDRRVEIVLYGGDEVAFITPAWQGWQALQSFYGKARGWDAFSYSAGVVFCHSNAPIHAISRLAKDLVEFAKDTRKDAGRAKGNFAAYQVLESFDAIGGDLGDFMKNRYRKLEGALLRPEAIDLIDESMEYWRTSISKRKLYALAQRVSNGAPIDADSEVRGLLDAKSVASENAASTLMRLHGEFGDAAFLHLLDLWDYAGLRE